ncbi:MAG: hypothetical protein HN731_16275 [Rhodospirillaceae bacterium]|nr:hypothetical protein [Rhodospirillaceae bacterium]
MQEQIELLNVFSYRLPEKSISTIHTYLDRLKDLELAHKVLNGVPDEWVSRHQTTTTLTVDAINSLIHLRYFDTAGVFATLLRMSTIDDQQIGDAALDGLNKLASFDIAVFYGPNNTDGIGPEPQLALISDLEGLSDDALAVHFLAVLSVVDSLLSPTMETTSSTFKTVTWSNTFVPAQPDIISLRSRCLDLLERMYGLLDSVGTKQSIIEKFEAATRTHHQGEVPDEAREMVSANTRRVLEFYSSLLSTENLAILQKIEHHSYWHFVIDESDQVQEIASQLEEAIALNEEYQIYKTLIGFEGLFFPWAELRASDRQWERAEDKRKHKATEYVEAINEQNFDEWRNRIVEYARTRSDDMATFPVFFQFLHDFAERKADLAMRLLEIDSDQISEFMIPIMRGLWGGELNTVMTRLIGGWIGDKRFITQCARMFIECETLDQDLLLRLLDTAKESYDAPLLRSLIAVGTSNFSETNNYLLDEIVVPAIEIMTAQSDASWIDEFWFRKSAKTVISAMSDTQVDSLLTNLLQLNEIDYHADELLSRVATTNPGKILDFFGNRFQIVREERSGRTSFDAVPYQLHKLMVPLQVDPVGAVQTITGWYTEDDGLFRFEGGRLLKNIFPVWSADFERALMELVDTNEKRNVESVLEVLLNYEGEPFLHGICKHMVSCQAEEEKVLNTIENVLMNTGVVSGEFGFPEAYERKAEEISNWLDDSDEHVREFASGYIKNLNKMAAAQRRNAKEEIELGKHIYGE